MFNVFKQQVSKGIDVHLYLSTGKEIIGNVSDIQDTYVVIISKDGNPTTVFEKLLGGWEIIASDETSINIELLHEESKDILDPTITVKFDEIWNEFDENGSTAKLKLKPPIFSLPSHIITQTNYAVTKKEWDRINSQYQHYLKNENLLSIPRLAEDLVELAEKQSNGSSFFFNAGCFLSTINKNSEAIQYFDKAFKSKQLPEYIYNLAYSAMELKNYKKAHISLALYFNKIFPSSDIDAWYIFCNLTQQLNGYYALEKIIDFNFTSENEREFEISDQYHDSLILLCKSVVYFSRENDKISENIALISFLEDRDYGSDIHSLINSALEVLPHNTDNSGYEEAISVLEKNDDKKYKQEQNQSNINIKNMPKLSGYIHTYKPDRNFGFLKDSYGTDYFFHGSAIIDDSLFNKLKNLFWEGKIPVVFEVTQGPKGPIAIQISLHRNIDVVVDLAKDYADTGDYSKAIAQIKKVLTDDPHNLNITKLYKKWREYARISGVPKGSNTYARARRSQLIEKDFPLAEQLLNDAVNQGDNAESAVKDLAVLLDQLERPKEAIKVLETNREIVRDKQSLDNLLINMLQKTDKHEKARKLLNKKLELPLTDERKSQILLQIAISYLREENYAEAELTLKKSITIHPDNITAKHNLAICLSKQNRHDEAEKILNQILAMFPDTKAVELLNVISQARETGVEVQLDEIITETVLSESSGELSGFTQFCLKNCDFSGVTPDRIKTDENGQKHYIGTEKNAKADIVNLENFAKSYGTMRPRERSTHYLSASRISKEINDDPNQFYKFLYRSFASRGDATVVENGPLDTAREWYCEALVIYDAVRNKYKDEQEAINALVRFLYSTLGQNQIPITPKIPTIDNTLNQILKHSPQREKVFDIIVYILRSRYAASRILQRLFKNSDFQALSIDYLGNRGVSIPATVEDLDAFVRLWNELRLKILEDMRAASIELQFLTNVDITTAWLENAIEQIKNIENYLFFDLDQQRVSELKKILENAVDLCRQVAFEEQERLSIQIDGRCRELIKETEDNPTRISIEKIIPIVEVVRTKVKTRLEELYDISIPQLTLRLAGESYVPDNNRMMNIQIEVENKIGCSPAESLEVVVQEDDELFTVNAPEIKLGKSLRGGEQQIIEIPLSVTIKAIESQTFSMPLYAQYHFRTGEIEQTSIENFSVRLYSEEEFEVIDNPYIYAESGVVDNPEMFYGREELIHNIVAAIQKSHTQNKSIIVFGQKRSGKSSILYHLKEKLEKERNLLILDLGNIGSILDEYSSAPLLHQIFRTILRKLEFAIEDRKECCTPLNMSFPTDTEFYSHQSPLTLFTDVFDQFLRQLNQSSDWKYVKIVILIDEFSYLYELIVAGNIPESFMKNWKALQEKYFSAVLVGQDVMPKFKQHFSNELGTAQDERVSYLKHDDAIKLIDEPIRIGGKKGESRYRERALERIHNLTAGSPFYIQIICNRLVDYMNSKRIILVTESHVEHIKNELIGGVNAFEIDKFENLINSGDSTKEAISNDDTLAVLISLAKNGQTGPCNRASINCTTSLPIDVILDDLLKRDVIERVREQYYQIRVGLFKEWLIANK